MRIHTVLDGDGKADSDSDSGRAGGERGTGWGEHRSLDMSVNDDGAWKKPGRTYSTNGE